MSSILPLRRATSWLLLSSALTIAYLTGPVKAQQAQEKAIDPVEELRQALRIEDVRAPNEYIVDFRRRNLTDKIAGLKTLGDLRRALALDEWKEEPNTAGRNETLRLIDEEMRKVVGGRLREAVRRIIAKGPVNARLAVANMLAEMGPTIAALEFNDKRGFASSLTPEAVKLARDPDIGVRQEGLRALGTINPDPAKAIEVFRDVVKLDAPEPRVLAAQGLMQMMKVANQLRKRGQGTTRIDASIKEVLTLAELVVPVCQIGLGDEDPRVRAASLDGIRTAALGMVDLIYEPLLRRNFPPEGRKLTEDEVKEIIATHDLVRREVAELSTMLKAFQQASGAMIAPLSDKQASVRLSAVNALEAIAWSRYKGKRRIESIPVPSNVKIEPIAYDDPLGPFLAKGMPSAMRLLKDPEVRIRRSTLDLLENLGDAAVPAIPALIDALGDNDRFVRWAAARTLSEMPPEKAHVAVPALGRLLSDPDLNVRQAAAAGLEAMGPLAAPAISAIAQGLTNGDVEARIMVMGALIRLPLEAARPAAPQLIELLGDADPRLRKAAAETIGRFGPGAERAVPALRRLLGDENSEVRIAASDAMLAILSPAK